MPYYPEIKCHLLIYDWELYACGVGSCDLWWVMWPVVGTRRWWVRTILLFTCIAPCLPPKERENSVRSVRSIESTEARPIFMRMDSSHKGVAPGPPPLCPDDTGMVTGKTPHHDAAALCCLCSTLSSLMYLKIKKKI